MALLSDVESRALAAFQAASMRKTRSAASKAGEIWIFQVRAS